VGGWVNEWMTEWVCLLNQQNTNYMNINDEYVWSLVYVFY
jgi:hypothetical protein